LKIGIIGSGIAGLTAARLLVKQHEVMVFEKNDYIGGHANTIILPDAFNKLAVDTGFIVFNERNYPHFSSLIANLDIPIIPSDMSFSMSDRKSDFEFCSDWPRGVFADYRNLFRPSYWYFLKEIHRFNKLGKQYVDNQVFSNFTLEKFLINHAFSIPFKNHYLLPMTAAIWSMPFKNILAFPLLAILKFMDNHGLLSIDQHPQWRTIKGGSQNYIQKLIAPFRRHIYHQTVISVHRMLKGVQVISKSLDGSVVEENFDHVIFANHADEALAILKTQSLEETKFLKAFKYQANETYLHQDESFMPKRQKAWASWNTIVETEQTSENPVCVTYWMNRLQNIPEEIPIFVTLNPNRIPSKVFNHFQYHHPQFNFESFQAQNNLCKIQGKDYIWYCGSYLGYGFHEDALVSGMNVANALGASKGW